MNKITKIFQPLNIIPKNATVKTQDITSKSQKLMIDLGLIRGTGCGSFHLLPLMQRSLEKCIQLVDSYMNESGSQKITIPQLTSVDLWIKSGRFKTGHTELLTTNDRHDRAYILGPTHEESITALLANVAPLSYRQFPLRLYQIHSKFRDELKPRFGLMRAREFMMKDCYSFDISHQMAEETYNIFNDIYMKLFTKIGVPFVRVKGDTGTMGGSQSHEFHFPAEIGEDSLVACPKCTFTANAELCGESNKCPSCNVQCSPIGQGIEVGHTFMLNDKYSKILKATFLQANGKPAPLQMGCYGIGITRLIAASIESLSTANEIRWPFCLAPFSVCLIPPKEGSKEESIVGHHTERIYHELNEINLLRNSIVVDDRTTLTIGKRLMEAKRMGYPMIIVIGPRAVNVDSKFELHLTNSGAYLELTASDLLSEIIKFTNDNLQTQ